jgi:hypothetical protein
MGSSYARIMRHQAGFVKVIIAKEIQGNLLVFLGPDLVLPWLTLLGLVKF